MDNTSIFFLVFGLNKDQTILNSLMVFGAEYVIYITLIFIFLAAYKGGIRERKALIIALFSLPVLVLIIKLIHLFIYEPRPYVVHDISPLILHSDGASFPSRHATIMSAIAISFLYFKSKWAVLLLIFTLWVGISRMYVGVHYPLDILGGFLTGGVSVAISLWIKKILKLRFFR